MGRKEDAKREGSSAVRKNNVGVEGVVCKEGSGKGEEVCWGGNGEVEGEV